MPDCLLLRGSGGDGPSFRHIRFVGLVCLRLLVRFPLDDIGLGVLSFNLDEAFPY